MPLELQEAEIRFQIQRFKDSARCYRELSDIFMHNFLRELKLMSNIIKSELCCIAIRRPRTLISDISQEGLKILLDCIEALYECASVL